MAYIADLFQYQDVTGPVFTPAAAPAPDLSWQPEYPDRIDRLYFLADRQQAYAANIQPEVTIARAWGPSYPDQIDRLLVHPSQIPSEFEPPFSVRDLGHIGWEPEYPDWIDRKTMLPSLQQSLALELAARALGHIGWKPEFSDFARPAASVPWHQFLALEPFPRPDVTFVNPSYPDRFFPTPTQLLGGETAPPSSPRDLGHTGWYPVYPDWLVLRVPQPVSGESAPPSSVQPLGHIGWDPEFPDLIWPTQGLQKDLQQWLALDPFPRPNAPAPDLSWDPEYPDQIFRIALPVGVPFTWRNVEPIVVASPDLAWKPVYPDQIWVKQLYSAHLTVFVTRLDAPAETVLQSWKSVYPDWIPQRRALPTMGSQTGAEFEQSVAPLKWEPEFPNWVDRRELPRALYQFYSLPPLGELIAIGQRMAWKFHEPEWLERQRPVDEGGLFYTIPPFVPAGENLCVELVDIDFTVPQLINQLFTSPSLVPEEFTVPQLIDQDLC